jgi:hypothetical protein
VKGMGVNPHNSLGTSASTRTMTCSGYRNTGRQYCGRYGRWKQAGAGGGFVGPAARVAAGAAVVAAAVAKRAVATAAVTLRTACVRC